MTYKTSINVIDFLVRFTSKFSVILSNFNPILGKKSPRCFPPNIFHQILSHRNFEDFHRKLHRNLAKSHRNFFHRKYFHRNFFSPKFFALNVLVKNLQKLDFWQIMAKMAIFDSFWPKKSPILNFPTGTTTNTR